MLGLLESILIAAAPAIAAIAGCITAYFKMKANNSSTSQELKDQYAKTQESNDAVIAQAKETRLQYEALLAAFNESVQLNKELLTKLDGVDRKEV